MLLLRSCPHDWKFTRFLLPHWIRWLRNRMCFFDFDLAAHHTYHTPTFKLCLLSTLCQMLLDVRDTNKNWHGVFPMELSEMTATSFAWGS